MKNTDKNSTEITYEYMREKIISGAYRPSQKLLEMDLSKELKVSRNTVRNAFYQLEKEGLIIIEKNKGAKVKSFNMQEVMNILEIRAVLESVIIESSVVNVNNETVMKLESLLSEMKNNLSEGNLFEYSNCNKRFHKIIYDYSDNQEAVEMVNTIKTQLIRFHFRTILIPDRKENSFKEHKRILSAIKNRDVDEAKQAILEHILNVREVIKQNYNLLS